MSKTLKDAVLAGAAVLWGEGKAGPPGLSMSGKCPRAVSYKAAGVAETDPPDAAAFLSFEKGRRSEAALMDAIEAGGFVVRHRQRHVNLNVGLPDNPLLVERVCGGHREHACGATIPAGCVPGHIDGMVGPVLIELKETGEGKEPYTLKNGEVREGYGFLRIAATGADDDSYFGRLPRMQVTACATALRQGGETVAFGKVLYANKGVKKGSPIVAEVDIDVGPEGEAAVIAWWADIYMRAARAAALTGGILPRPPTLDPFPSGRQLNRGHEACRFCGWETACWGGEK